MPNVKKNQLAHLLEDEGMYPWEAKETIDIVSRAIHQALVTSGSVYVGGLGEFVVSVSGPRELTNVHTGERKMVDKTTRVLFRPARKLKDAVCGRTPHVPSE